MEILLNRYRNIVALLVLIVAQMLLLAYQVRNDKDVRLIRVWAVTAVTPAARVIETVRSAFAGFLGDYVNVATIRSEHHQLKDEVSKLKLENQFLKGELATADRARALAAFQQRIQSKTVAARVIGIGAGSGSNVRFIDRGTTSGVMKGMPVITADGIVGRVTSVFPFDAQILLISDPNFAAGVISEKNRVRGILRGLGNGRCRVDYIEPEAKIVAGERFFTSGDDRVFPKGFPAGRVRSLRQGTPFQEVLIDPLGFQLGIEEVLVVLEGMHQELPEEPGSNSNIYLGTLPAETAAPPVAATPSPAGTEADRVLQRFRSVGESQGHKFGEGGPGTRPPDFSGAINPATPARPQTQRTPAGQPGSNQPSSSQPGSNQPAGTPQAAPQRPSVPPPQTTAPGVPRARNT